MREYVIHSLTHSVRAFCATAGVTTPFYFTTVVHDDIQCKEVQWFSGFFWTRNVNVTPSLRPQRQHLVWTQSFPSSKLAMVHGDHLLPRHMTPSRSYRQYTKKIQGFGDGLAAGFAAKLSVLTNTRLREFNFLSAITSIAFSVFFYMTSSSWVGQ